MINQVMKQLNDSRSIVVNNVNYFTVHSNLKKMSPIPPILAISKQHISVGGPTNMERTNHVNTFDIKQNWKRIYSIFKARFLWRARETVDGTRGNQSLRGNFFFFLLMGERSLETDDGNYIIGSERAVGAGG